MLSASFPNTANRKGAQAAGVNGACSEAELRQANVEIFRVHLMPAIMEAKRHVSTSTLFGHGAGKAVDFNVGEMLLTPGGFTHDRDASERVCLVKPASDRSSRQRKGSVTPAMEMDDRRQFGDAVLRFRRRIPENPGEGHGAGEPVAELAKCVPGHGGSLREASDERIGAVESEPPVKVVEDARYEGCLVPAVSRRIRMRPGPVKPVHRDEGETVTVCSVDERPMLHLQLCGASIAVKEDVGAFVSPVLRQFDPIRPAFDSTRDGTSAGPGADVARMKADSSQNDSDSVLHVCVSLAVTVKDVAAFPLVNNFTPVHVVARAI